MDRQRAELSFTSGLWFWRRYVLRFEDVQQVSQRELEQGIYDDSEPIRNRVIFAQLWSGEFVLLAIDPRRRSASLYREIRQSVEAYYKDKHH